MKTPFVIAGSLIAALLVPVLPAEGQSYRAWTWRFQVPGVITCSPAVADDGTVYVVSTSTTSSVLYAVSPSGVEQWNVAIAPGGHWSSPAIGADGTIYVGDHQGDCLAITPTGQIRWSVPTGQPPQNGTMIVSEPAIGVDGTIYVASFPTVFGDPSMVDSPEKLFALSPDGHTNWIASLEPSSAIGQHISSPGVGPDGSIYIGCSTNLYCVSTEGVVKWKHHLPGGIQASPAFGSDGTIYIGSGFANFYAITPDGQRKWTYSVSNPTGGTGFVESSAAVAADGTIRIAMWASQDLRALSATGELLWTVLSSYMTGSSPALDSSGNVYILFYWAGFRCYDSGGSAVWYSDLGYFRCESSPVITSDGTVLVGENDYLFAFEGDQPLMQSAWPMHRHDAKRTARAVQRGLKLLGVEPNGDVNLELRLEPERPYVVQSSTDLVDWADEVCFTPDTWKKQLVLPGKPGPKFFRLQTTLE